MIGRIYCIASLFFVINIADILGLPFVNAFEKGLYLLLSVAILMFRRVDPINIALMIATIILVVMAGALTQYNEFSWLTLILSLNQFIIIYILIGFTPTSHDREMILKTSAWLPFACVAAGFVGMLITGHSMFGGEYGVDTERLRGARSSAFLSGIAMTGVVASLILGLEWRRHAYLLIAGGNLVILMLAGGRAAFAVTVLVAAGLIIFSRIIHIRDKIFMLIAVIISLPAVVAIGFQYIFKRLATSGDNGREVMGEYLWSMIEKYPLSGIGFGHQYWDTPEAVSIVTGSSAAHNDYLRILVEIGYVGGSLFYIFLSLAVLRSALRNGYFNMTVIISFAGFLILSMSDNAIATPPYFPLLVIAILSNFVPSDRISIRMDKPLIPFGSRYAALLKGRLFAANERGCEG